MYHLIIVEHYIFAIALLEELEVIEVRGNQTLRRYGKIWNMHWAAREWNPRNLRSLSVLPAGRTRAQLLGVGEFRFWKIVNTLS